MYINLIVNWFVFYGNCDPGICDFFLFLLRPTFLAPSWGPEVSWLVTNGVTEGMMASVPSAVVAATAEAAAAANLPFFPAVLDLDLLLVTLEADDDEVDRSSEVASEVADDFRPLLPQKIPFEFCGLFLVARDRSLCSFRVSRFFQRAILGPQNRHFWRHT